MEEYEWAAQWCSYTDSWLKHKGWIGEWTGEAQARANYAAMAADRSFLPPYGDIRLVRRVKAGPVEVVE